MTVTMNRVLDVVRARIEARSAATRARYLAKLAHMRAALPPRRALSCSNIAHVVAGCGQPAKSRIVDDNAPNIGIVTAYNDMLSAHQPFETYPALIRHAAADFGATAQVAGGVPAMCDGVTQGQPGMELSLFSRDVVAMATAIALSHNSFDAVLLLGVCDKIIPGLVIGALAFGHLPAVFVPAGPMPSGIPNDEKTRVRQRYAAGEAGRAELLEAELASYHSPGTCTFYGTANSNQMLMEMMGLHVPASAFAPPDTDLRAALTREAVRAASAAGQAFRAGQAVGLGERIDARTFINGIVGLHATGGSTNHLIHLVAMARAAGFLITWEDFADIARVTPLLARIYPNGPADVNQFHAAGGLGFIIRDLLAAGLLHDIPGVVDGQNLSAHASEALMEEGRLRWRAPPATSLDNSILRSTADPFQSTGGLALVTGNLGRAVVKTSAVAPERRAIVAPARVFDTQDAFQQAFRAGAFREDVVVVLRGQGPGANGMPELHGLMPPLAVLQARGLKVALVTDGRLSGASGKILAALHVTPEAQAGGALARLCDGDVITLDAEAGLLQVDLDEATFAGRQPATIAHDDGDGLGRDLFRLFRSHVTSPDTGAHVF